MEQKDFFEMFFSNLRSELNDDEFVDVLEHLIKSDRFNKSNYLNAIRGE